jgi:hypothetical protein
MWPAWIHFVPEDPAFVPPRVAAQNALVHLRDAAPDDAAVNADAFPNPVLFTRSGSISKAFCNCCGLPIELSWWDAAMNHAHESHYSSLRVTTPCCGCETSLNDLKYEPPAAFGRCHIVMLGGPEAEAVHRRNLERILGCKLKVIVEERLTGAAS